MKTLKDLLTKARLVLVSSCVVGLFWLSGCANDEDNPEPVESALVGIYHAVPNANGLDITLNISGTINRNPFEYEDYIGYLNFYAGERTLKLSEREIFSRVLVDTTLLFVKNKYYSVFVAGSYPNTEALVFEDVAAAPRTGRAMLRVINLSPDAPALAINADGENLFSDLAFKDGTDFEEISAGRLSFELEAAADVSNVLLTIPSVQIDAGEYLTMIIKGYTNPPGENPHELSVDFIRH